MGSSLACLDAQAFVLKSDCSQKMYLLYYLIYRNFALIVIYTLIVISNMKSIQIYFGVNKYNANGKVMKISLIHIILYIAK